MMRVATKVIQSRSILIEEINLPPNDAMQPIKQKKTTDAMKQSEIKRQAASKEQVKHDQVKNEQTTRRLIAQTGTNDQSAIRNRDNTIRLNLSRLIAYATEDNQNAQTGTNDHLRNFKHKVR